MVKKKKRKDSRNPRWSQAYPEGTGGERTQGNLCRVIVGGTI